MEDRARHIPDLLGQFAQPPFALRALASGRGGRHAEALRLLEERDAGGPELARGIRRAERLAPARERLEQAAHLQREVRG